MSVYGLHILQAEERVEDSQTETKEEEKRGYGKSDGS